MMRPLGSPPTPRATSRATDPVGMTETGGRVSSPRRMTEPLPKLLSIWARAVARALERSWVWLAAGIVLPRFSERLSAAVGMAGQLRRDPLSGAHQRRYA